MAITKASALINPEVLADAISAELPNAIKFAPHARIDTTLVGVAGDTITRPKYAYIGPAEDLTEGVPMDTTQMSMTTTTVTVKEAGKATEITEQAILTNINGTLSETASQLAKSIADKIDIDYVAALGTTALSFTGAPTSAASIIDATALFNDEDVEDYILFINPTDYNELRKEMIVGNTFLSRVQLAELLGLKEIVTTNRLTAGTAFIQKAGAVEIVYKKRPDMAIDGDILLRTVVTVVNTFYTVNLFNDAGVVKISE